MRYLRIAGLIVFALLGLCAVVAWQNTPTARSNPRDRNGYQQKAHEADQLPVVNRKETGGLNLGSLPSPPAPSHKEKLKVTSEESPDKMAKDTDSEK